MKKLTEKELLNQLGIPNWRHLTHDQYIELASSLYRVDPEVALAIINQFPDFKDMSVSMVSAYKSLLDNAITSADKSIETYYSAAQEALKIVERELERDDYSSSERVQLVELMIEISQSISKKDTEHKEFLTKMAASLGGVAVAITACAAIVLGGNVRRHDGDGPKSEIEG